MDFIDCTPILTEAGLETTISAQLSNAWNLIVFLRHADCIECQLITHELNSIYAALTQWSVQLTLVANCPWEDLSGLRERLQLQSGIAMVTEPTLKAHQLAGLNNSLVGGFGPRAMWNILKGTQKGFHQKLSLGDNMGQQSGLFLIRPNRQVAWSHRSKFLGDIPEQSTILESVLTHCALGVEP